MDYSLEELEQELEALALNPAWLAVIKHFQDKERVVRVELENLNSSNRHLRYSQGKMYILHEIGRVREVLLRDIKSRRHSDERA